MYIKQAQDIPDFIDAIKSSPSEDIFIIDHLGGFNALLQNNGFDLLVNINCTNPIYLQYIITPELKSQNSSININFSAKLQNSINFTKHIK